MSETNAPPPSDNDGGGLLLSEDTLSRWETRRIGPPCVRVGRRVLYRRGAVQEWLRSQEERVLRRPGGRS